MTEKYYITIYLRDSEGREIDSCDVAESDNLKDARRKFRTAIFYSKR
jgi:hypothetical protein